MYSFADGIPVYQPASTPARDPLPAVTQFFFSTRVTEQHGNIVSGVFELNFDYIAQVEHMSGIPTGHH